jgi:uncharacterized protein YjbI with pentapeptide repeats
MEHYRQLYTTLAELPDQWTGHTFEQCTFQKLSPTQTMLAGANFINCRFEQCMLIRSVVKQTQFNDVLFTGCAVQGVDFGTCNPFGFHADFQACQLDQSIFLNRRLVKAKFVECSIKSVLFIRCDMTGSTFDRCDLELAKFDDNTLNQADFSTSFNITLDPDVNRLKKAKFSLYSLPGLLTKHNLIVNS